MPELARDPSPWSLTHPARRSVRQRLVQALSAFLVAAFLSSAAAVPAVAGPPDRREQQRFMWAMAGQESGWDYYARNASSGAFGKYQIMPFNWPVWAAEYLGDAQADQTPWNQERVAFGKLHDLYRWLGSWKRVAYWWLTGRSDRDERRWSSYARGYVRNIMRLRKRAPGSYSMPARTSSIAARGDWRRSADDQKLRVAPGKRAWPNRGGLRDGQVLKVRGRRTAKSGVRWLQVLTADGRLGWLKQLASVPARRPDSGRRWRDVRDRGGSIERADRRDVRPRPR